MTSSAATLFLALFEKRQKIIPGEGCRLIRFAKCGVGETSLALLKGEDPLFNRIAGNQSIHHHRALLANAVRTVGSLTGGCRTH